MSSYYQLSNLDLTTLENTLQDFIDAKTQICDIRQFRSIITKAKAERTQEQIRLAIKFLKGLSMFSSIQNDDELDLNQLLLELIDAMECEAVKQGEIIFNYKDKASKFYIILKGSVDIYMPKTEEERKTDALKLEKLIQKKIRSLQRSQTTEERDGEFSNEITNCQKVKQLELILANNIRNISKAQIEALDSLFNCEDYFQINIEELISKLKKVTTLGPGTYFGEVALTMDCLRSAKAVAASDLHVATLCKADYKKILHHTNGILKGKVAFFTKLLGLTSNDAISVARFCYGFQEKNYMFGQKIFKQGEIPQEVFLVKQGEVQMSTQEIPNEEYHRERGSRSIRKKKQLLTKKLASWGAYSFIGESEALNMRRYDMTAASISNETILYVISAQDFRLLQATYKDIFQRIFAKHETKAAYLKDRLENLHALTNMSDRSPPRTISPILTNQHIKNLHSSKSIEEKYKKFALPKLQDKSAKKTLENSVNYHTARVQKEEPISPTSFFSNSTPRCRPAIKKTGLPQGKTESTCTSNEPTPRNTSKDKSTFGDYFNTSQESSGCLNSRLSRFVHKLNKRKLKEAEQDSIGILIRSQRKFKEDQHKSVKIDIKQNKFLPKDALGGSSSECDSYIGTPQAIKKTIKPSYSFIV